MVEMLHRAPRYFDPPCSWLSYENNDMFYKRKKQKKRKRCYNCGDIGHEGNSCKHVNYCFICSEKGHLIINCPDKYKEMESNSALCLKCGNTGHNMFSCSKDYNSEDLKGIECYTCKEFGHLNCAENKTEVLVRASCYKCGESSHFGSDCIKSIEVAIELQPVSLCSKCGERGHFQRACTKIKKITTDKDAAKSTNETKKATPAEITMDKDATKSAKWKKNRRYRGGKKTKQMENGNNVASQSQPNRARNSHRPQIVGPFYGKPGSNVWLSPAAAVARNSNLKLKNGEINSPHQMTYNHVPAPTIM